MVLGRPDPRGELAFGAAAFAAVFALGGLVVLVAEIAAKAPELGFATTSALAGVAYLGWRTIGRRIWHLAANAFAPYRYAPIARPYVIDGDTIDDLASGVRYRFANIDAPETGDGARCATERWAGEDAKAAVEALIYNAASVTVRPTWRTDCYGRKVAFVYADGVDIGELLIGARLAVRWRGARLRWCGARGGFAKLAALDGNAFACRACMGERRIKLRRSAQASRLRRSL